MGSTVWKGDTLCAGYSFYVDEKELELDIEIQSTQVPSHIKFPQREDISNGTSNPSKSTSPKTPPRSEVTRAVPTTVPTRFVPPASFYGMGKPKPKGPLYAPIVSFSTLFYQLDSISGMTRRQRVLL